MSGQTETSSRWLGRSPDSFSLAERRAAIGKWFAFEIYTPENLALRLIAAVGDSAGDCAAQLQARGLNPAHYEFVLQQPPY